MPKIGRFTNAEVESTYLRAYETLAAQWAVPSTEIDVETSFGTTRVRKSGAGEGAPLLLLPGISGNCLFWSPFIEELARGRVVYTPDIIGWPGRCVQTAPVRDETDVAKWVAEVITGLGVDRVHLVGYSLGAWIAAVAGAHHPDRLASLSLLEPTPAVFARLRWGLIFKFIVAGIRPTKAKMQKLNEWLSPTIELTDDEWTMVLSGLKFRLALPLPRPLTDERFAAITTPLLILFGADTVLHDPEQAASRARQHVPSADIESYPGVGHDMLWAIPEQVIPRLLAFADKHDSARV
ncbi:alpha/beta fold hydrolase [Nocardia sp. NPDC050175]|uniref:alpha/beta fold hydrolase n=1 Tax=Nocardia sp. NPDC050175 TaxID=3364317 RepID=UPI0037A45B5C